MRNYTFRMIVYSSLAIVLLIFVWGVRQIPATHRIGEEAVQTSLDQELVVLSSAVRATTQALKYRLLDVLKAEGGDRTSRAFQDSPFVAATLLQWDQAQWKTLWHSVKSKTDFQAAEIREALQSWPLASIAPDEVHYLKLSDVQGQAFFAVIVPVRRPNQVPMFGVGIFPAMQFGLQFSVDQSREIRVFDSKGFALALSRPAYLGSSLMREPLVKEMLEGEEVRAQLDWTTNQGERLSGRAVRIAGSNLVAAIESPLRPGENWTLRGWLYLGLCGLGAIALNWFLFTNLLKPLLAQLNQAESLIETLRRQLRDAPVAQPKGVAIRPELKLSPLAHLDFQESAAPIELKEDVETSNDSGSISLERLVDSSLRRLDDKIKEIGVNVMQLGLEGALIQTDPMQFQTALDEVLKNAIEAMQTTTPRNLTLSLAHQGDVNRLTVEDSGSGIAEADLEKVFDPFFSTKDNEGVARGLGLNVVRRVMEELSGSVKVISHQNSEGSATRVILEWPSAEGEVSPAPSSQAPTIEMAAPTQKDWPEVEIRKPRVRTLD